MRVDARALRVALLGALLFVFLPTASRAQTEGYGARLRPLIVRDLIPSPLVLHDFEARDWQENESGYGVIDDRPGHPRRLDRTPHAVQPESAPAPASANAAQRKIDAQSIDLQNRLSEVRVADGLAGISVTVETEHGDAQLTPEEYVRAIREAQETQRSNGFLYVLFNITRAWGFVWVGAGFLAQALFTYRMILQWWASEKHKRSVVPVGYWWGSLFGGMLLFAYFIWRKDIVGYLGQSTGVFIYARNLVLIYRGRRIEAEGARTLPPEELPPEELQPVDSR